ncbi:MAG: ankyrin repeat domain-containing protein [Fimbriimonadaceae bacterium]|nr:ankyrin repeat domain-containing protein [Fimbriimonadaceae bacterium]
MIGKVGYGLRRTLSITFVTLSLLGAIVWAVRLPASNELFAAVKSQSAQRVRQLLSTGADPNVKDSNGMTVLNLACKMGSSDIVMALLDAGADPTSESDELSPYAWAALSGSVEAITALSSYAEVAKVDTATEPALCYASSPEVARALVRAGASAVGVSKRFGMSGLQRALVEQKYKAATTMMTEDHRLNKQSLMRSPILHLLSRSIPAEPHPEQWVDIDAFVRAALGKGVTIGHCDEGGKLAFDYLRSDVQRAHFSQLLGLDLFDSAEPTRVRPSISATVRESDR